MRDRQTWVAGWFVVAALAASPGVARAQYRSVMGGPILLDDARVQKELGINAEQEAKVAEVSKVTRGRVQEAMRGERQLPPAEGHQRMMQAAQKINAEMTAALARTLGPRQLQRFEELRYHYIGAEGFGEPALQDRLKMSAAQRSQAVAINQEAHAETRRLMSEEKAAARTGKAGEVREEKAEELDVRRQSMAKVEAILSDDQRRAYEALRGEPLEPHGESALKRRVR